MDIARKTPVYWTAKFAIHQKTLVIAVKKTMNDNLKISVIGVPTNSAGKPNGVAKAPSVLRKTGLIDALSKYCDVIDVGDVEFSELITQRNDRNHIIGYDSLVSMVYSVKAAVRDTLAKNRFPIVIGGDCPILLGCLCAINEIDRNSGLFFIDGHEDAYAPIQSPTGEAADMELGIALGLNLENMDKSLTSILPAIKKENTCMLGPRDKEILQNTGIRSLSGEIPMHDDVFIETHDVDEIIGHELLRIGSKVSRWWLHVDLDVLSSEELPAVDYLQSGGVGWDKLESLTSALLSNTACSGWNVTIYNPDLDPTRKYAKRIVNYFENVMSTVCD